MTVRAPKRRDQVAVVSAQVVFGRGLLLQRAGLAIVDSVRLTWRHQQPSRVRREVGRDQPPPREPHVIGQACPNVE
jgi:hypothetical protein